MMIRSHSSLRHLLFALALAACGEDAQSLPAAGSPVAATPSGKPWETIPAESIYGATPVENLVTTPVEMDVVNIPEGWDGMRIAAISDLQLGLWAENEAVALAATQRAAQLDPDLIVLLGDYIARGSDTAALGRVLAPLRAHPTVAVLGDRDIGDDSLAAAIATTLGARGIRVLLNGSVPFIHNQDTAYIAGVNPELAESAEADQRSVLSRLGAGRPGLLIAHNPVLAARAPPNRFPAVLAGNTFCGRIDMPGTPRLSWLDEQGIPAAVVRGVPRLYRLGKSVMFVTCGVGYSFVPIRFGAPPEVASITLRRSVAAQTRIAPDSVDIDTLIGRFQNRDTSGGN